MNIQNVKGRDKRMMTLTKYQCEVLSELGLHIDKEYSLQDIIEILPESIEEKEIGRFDYELTIRKHEVCYESYDALDNDGNPYVLIWFSTNEEECNSLLDCAFEMLKWCLKENYVSKDE